AEPRPFDGISMPAVLGAGRDGSRQSGAPAASATGRSRVFSVRSARAELQDRPAALGQPRPDPASEALVGPSAESRAPHGDSGGCRSPTGTATDRCVVEPVSGRTARLRSQQGQIQLRVTESVFDPGSILF